MKQSTCLKLVAAVTLATLLNGCSTSTLTSGMKPGGGAPPSGASIAVVPFENLSSHRQAGLIMTDLATTMLTVEPAYQVKEVSSLTGDDRIRLRQLEVDPWERQVGVNTAAAVKVGEALKVDYVLAGAVGEYGFVDGFGETANVGLSLRLVQVSNGEVVWAGSLSRKAASPAFNDESVHRLAHQMLIELLTRMNQQLAAAR